MAPAPGEANPGRGYSGGSRGGRAGMRGRPVEGVGGARIFPGKGKLGAPAGFREALTQPLWAPRPCLGRNALSSGNAAFALGNHRGAFDTGTGDGGC